MLCGEVVIWGRGEEARAREVGSRPLPFLLELGLGQADCQFHCSRDLPRFERGIFPDAAVVVSPDRGHDGAQEQEKRHVIESLNHRGVGIAQALDYGSSPVLSAGVFS